MPSINMSRGALTVACAAGLAAAVQAQTFVFSNDCGTGSWGASCSLGGGQWRSNWGRTGSNPSLLIPGAADTCLIAGTVNLDVNATIAGLTVPAGATLNWQPVTFSFGAMTNSGAVAITGGGNRFFSGSATNGSTWSIDQGALYVNGSGTLANSGTLTLSNSAALNRTGGSQPQAVLSNGGMVRAAGTGGSIGQMTVTSTPSAVWRTEPGAVLTLNADSLSGTFVGDIAGATDAIGTIDLAGDTTLSTVVGSNPWGWTTATVLTGPFTLTNSGRIETSGAANKFFSGAIANGPAGEWRHTQGALYFNAGAPLTSFTNDGLLTLGQGASVRRNGGVIEGAVLINGGIVQATQSDGLVQDLTVMSDNGLWSVDQLASLTLLSDQLAGTFTGALTGDAYLEGTLRMADDTVFTTTANSQRPWQWTTATVITDEHSMTNAGWLRTVGTSNKFISGTVINAPGALWDHAEGALYFNTGTPATTLTNNGLMTLGNGASVRRNGGTLAEAIFVNASTVRAAQPGGAVADLSVQSNNGNWQADAGASLELFGGRWAGSFVGQFAGDAFLTGSPTLFGDASFTTTPASANPWRWASANVTAGGFTLTNAGRMEMTTTANKFLSGQAANSAGAVWTVAQGTFYFNPVPFSTTFTNHGTVSLLGGSAIARNGGATADAAFSSDGNVVGAGPDTRLQGLALTSNNGTWRTTAGNSLEFAATTLAGRFVFDNAGATFASGNIQLTADTTFTTSPTSPNPFQWTSAFIDAATSTFTNTGRLEMTTAANKFIAGAFVNAAGAQWTCAQGNLYLNAGSSTPTHLDNNGTLTLLAGTSLSRNTPVVADTTLNNNSLLIAASAGSSVASLTVNNNSGGIIRIPGTLDLPTNWTMQNGRLDGTGTFTSTGNGFVNAGVVAPGPVGATGVLSSGHRFNQSASGVLEIALVNDGTTQNASKLALINSGFTGQASLGGTLRVTLPAGTSPEPIGGRSYVIVDAPGGLSGTFSSIVAADPVTDVRYSVTYNSTQAVLHVIRRCSGADLGSVGADTNFDGQLDNNDFVVFINLFFAQDSRADVGQAGGLVGLDGQFDNNDFIAFITLFFNGCP